MRRLVDWFCRWVMERAIKSDWELRTAKVVTRAPAMVGSVGTVGFVPRIPRGHDDG